MSGRIGKVRMKATGFEFRVIPGPPEPKNDAVANLLRHARMYAEKGDDLVGHVIIGLYSNGAFDCGFRFDDKNSPIPRTLMPSYIAEVLRREMIGKMDAGDTFDSMFQWVE